MHLVQLQECPWPFTISSETRGDLLIVVLCKIKKQITFFQITMVHTTYCHSEWEDLMHSEEILDQSKSNHSRANPNPIALCPMSRWLLLLLLLTATYFSLSPLLSGCFHFLYAATLLGSPQLWNLQYLGVSSTIQASPSQLCTMVSLGVHTGTPQPPGLSGSP